MRSAWIMCGGPSADRKLSVSGDIIAVNKDMFRYAEEARYTITMDNRFTVLELTNHQRETPKTSTNIFVVNMADENMRHTKSFYDARWGISYDLSHYDMIVKSYGVHGFGETWKEFRNGGNSGYCALQLALILGYKEIHLVGMDLGKVDGRTHHHKGYIECKDDYEGRFAEFSLAIMTAITNDFEKFPEVKLINHSPVSPLRSLIGYEPV